MADNKPSTVLPLGFQEGEEIVIEPPWSDLDEPTFDEGEEEPSLSDVLTELRAIRALLERQTAVLAWHSGLQRSPFSPSPVDPEQAAEEARSAALARQSADPGVSLTRIDSL